MAVIECVPRESIEVEQVARFEATVPGQVMFETPSLKVTVPEELPLPGAVTEMVAVKVTDCPKTVGDPLVANATVVVAWLTCWVTVGDASEAEKLVSPL